MIPTRQRVNNTRGMQNEEALQGISDNGGGGDEKDGLHETDQQQLAKAGEFDDHEVGQATEEN